MAVAAVLVALTLAPAAPAWLLLGPDQTRGSGQIGFFVVGSGQFSWAALTETVNGADLPVRTLGLPLVLAADGGFSGAFLPAVLPWRCDRLKRSFKVVGHRPDGSTESAVSGLRTPSCANRLSLAAPRTTRVGGLVGVRISDRFKLGGVQARLCVRPPRSASTCSTQSIPTGQKQVAFAFRARRRGRYRVTVRAPEQQLEAVVAAGVPARPEDDPRPLVLATGDSMMQNVGAVLSDSLTGKAHVKNDVRVGSGVSKNFPIDWSTVPATQVKRSKPAATVMFLGTNEGWPMTAPSGREVTCCGEPWIAEYARRASAMIKTYLRSGSGAVAWLTVPAARDPKRKATIDAVNAALARATVGKDRVALVDTAALMTPGGVYRETMTDGGRTVDVRETDGIHLSAAGAEIATRAVTRALIDLGVI